MGPGLDVQPLQAVSVLGNKAPPCVGPGCGEQARAAASQTFLQNAFLLKNTEVNRKPGLGGPGPSRTALQAPQPPGPVPSQSGHRLEHPKALASLPSGCVPTGHPRVVSAPPSLTVSPGPRPPQPRSRPCQGCCSGSVMLSICGQDAAPSGSWPVSTLPVAGRRRAEPGASPGLSGGLAGQRLPCVQAPPRRRAVLRVSFRVRRC